MPINTSNAGALVGGSGQAGKAWVRMLKGTQVHSAGRDVQTGEKVEVSEDDARYLVAYNYAERIQQPATKAVVSKPEPEPEPESSSSTVKFAGIESTGPSVQSVQNINAGWRFTRRRDK